MSFKTTNLAPAPSSTIDGLRLIAIRRWDPSRTTDVPTSDFSNSGSPSPVPHSPWHSPIDSPTTTWTDNDPTAGTINTDTTAVVLPTCAPWKHSTDQSGPIPQATSGIPCGSSYSVTGGTPSPVSLSSNVNPFITTSMSDGHPITVTHATSTTPTTSAFHGNLNGPSIFKRAGVVAAIFTLVGVASAMIILFLVILCLRRRGRPRIERTLTSFPGVPSGRGGMWNDDSGSALPGVSTSPTRVRRPLDEWDNEDAYPPSRDSLSDRSSAAMVQVPGAAVLRGGYLDLRHSSTDHVEDGSDGVLSTVVLSAALRDYFSFDQGQSSTSSHSHWNTGTTSSAHDQVVTAPPVVTTRPPLPPSTRIGRGNVDPRMNPVHTTSLRVPGKSLQADGRQPRTILPAHDAEMNLHLSQTPWTNQSAVTLNDAEDYGRRMLADQMGTS